MRGDAVNTSGLYQALGVPQTATTAQIKKAYRTHALKSHPDKITNPTEADKVKWVKIQKAYDVLADPNKRKMYDSVGEDGLAHMEQMEQMSGGQNVAQILSYAIWLTCAIFAVFLFLIFLTLRVDDKTNWNYSVVMIPLWILDPGLFIMSFSFFSAPTHQDEEDEENFGKPVQESGCEKFCRIMFPFAIWAFIAEQILIVSKVDGGFSGDWVIVLIPYYIIELYQQFDNINEVIKICPRIDSCCDRFVVFFKQWRQSFCRIAFLILLVLQLDGEVDITWFVVLLPLWAPIGFFILLDFFIDLRMISHPSDTEEKKSQNCTMMFYQKFVLLIFWGLLWVLPLCLIAQYLDGGILYFGVALIPVWIFLVVALCCCCCFSAMGTCGASIAEAEAEEAAQQSAFENREKAFQKDDDQIGPKDQRVEKADYGSVAGASSLGPVSPPSQHTGSTPLISNEQTAAVSDAPNLVMPFLKIFVLPDDD